MWLLDGAGMIHTGGLHLSNSCGTGSLCLPNSCCAMGLCHPNSCGGASLCLPNGALQCFLQQASMDALVISSHPMDMFISLWHWITLAGRTPVSTSEGVLVGWKVGVLATLGAWLIGTVSSSIATCGNTWEEATTGMEESSILVEGGAPRAADFGLSGVESPSTWLEVSSITHDRSSWTSVVMLMWLSVLGRHSMVRWEGEDGVMVLWGAGALGVQSPSVTWERSTCRNEGSWVDPTSTS